MNWLKISNGVRDKMNSRSVSLLIVSFFLLGVAAVGGQVESSSLQYDRDFAQFRLNKEAVHLEIYYSIPRQGISHIKDLEGYRGAFQIVTKIIKNDTLLQVDMLNVEDRLESLAQISPGQKFAELSSFALAAGNYLIKSELIDLPTSKSIIQSDTIHITPFPSDKLILSSIEFASSIHAQKLMERKFDKNGLRIIPNADRIYGRDLPTLFFYAEAYNFAWEGEASDSTHQVSYKIKNKNGVAILDWKGKEKKKPGHTSVVYGSLDVSELASGTYSLELEVKDLHNMQLATTEKPLFIYNKSDFVKKSIDSEKPAAWRAGEKYQQMDEKQLDTYFNQLKYLADKDEKRIFKELSLEGKRNFFISFWAKRDPDPATPLNERESQYHELLEIANEKYSHVLREGWETDRGRVLLLYGKPDTRDIFPTSTETKAYEIWEYYNIEGGVKFIFVDKKQNGDYELVHSTKRGEISDSDWQMNHARL